MSFHQTIGLVLSGGGMRGIAHIGVIQALKEHNIEVDLISGASMGSLVGAMYARDIPTEEMLDFFTRITLFNFRNYSFWKPGIISSERFLPALRNLFQTDSFEDLNKQLYVSVTNMTLGKNQIIERGPLLQALMGSSAFPGIFAPVQVGNSLYSDGGITNNFPIEPLQSRCEFIIGSFVNPLNKMEVSDFKNSYSVLERAFHISMFYSELPSFHLADIFIKPNRLREIPTFSLKHIHKAFDMGYEEATIQIEQYLKNRET